MVTALYSSAIQYKFQSCYLAKLKLLFDHVSDVTVRLLVYLHYIYYIEL